MDLLSKYASVFQLGEKFKIKNGKIAIVDGKINLQGVVNILFEQKQLCKKIKSLRITRLLLLFYSQYFHRIS